ncbi:MAG: hypothetical protein LPK18_02510 [Pseudomonadaceae bacterium]|nr:hypothetical protein [Pseudomonadaceae bacterium]
MSLISLIVACAPLGIGYWHWRRARYRARSGFIARYRFPERLRLKLQERYPQLDSGQCQRVLDALREYFQLCLSAERRLLAMPSQAVDLAWHEFILYTRQYDEFCRRGLGRFLHHTPNDALPTTRSASDAMRRTWRLACLREGLRPDAATCLPLLFALDAELGIADGFHYRLDCGARPGDWRNAGAYCASHIGCGGGCSSGCGGDSSGDGGCGGGGD